MQQNGISPAHALHLLHDAFKIQIHLPLVQIIIRGDFQSNPIEYLQMVAPRRLADPDPAYVANMPQQIASNSQGTSSSRRLHGSRTLFLDRNVVIAKDQSVHHVVVQTVSVDRQITVWSVVLQQRFVCCSHSGHDRNLIVFVLVDAHRQIHLVGPRIRTKFLSQPEYWIRRRHGHVLKHGSNSAFLEACLANVLTTVGWSNPAIRSLQVFSGFAPSFSSRSVDRHIEAGEKF